MGYENISGNQLFELCTFGSCKRQVDSAGPLIIYTKSETYSGMDVNLLLLLSSVNIVLHLINVK